MAFELFVNGTLMRGLALHANLAGAEFLGPAWTAPIFRLYSIDDRHPGMFEVGDGGVSVAGELYMVSDEVWRRIEAGEPPISTAVASVWPTDVKSSASSIHGNWRRGGIATSPPTVTGGLTARSLALSAKVSPGISTDWRSAAPRPGAG